MNKIRYIFNGSATHLHLVLLTMLISISLFNSAIAAEQPSQINKQIVGENLANQSVNLNLLFVSAAHSNRAKVSLLEKIAQMNTSANWTITHKSASALSNELSLTNLFNQYDLVLLDAVSNNEAEKTYRSFLSQAQAAKTKIIAFNWAEKTAQIGLNSEQQNQLNLYWDNGGRSNFNHMLSYIAFAIFNQANPHKHKIVINAPIEFPEKGIYHPNQPNLISANLAQYQLWSAPKKNQMKIAILLQRALIETEQTQLVDTTIRMLEDKGAYVVPFFFNLSPASGDYSDLLQSEVVENGQLIAKKTEVDLIINFRNIHWANKRKLEFEQFGVPVMQAMTYYSGDKAKWESDMQGVAPGMMAFTLVLPETAGVVDPMIVAATDRVSQTTEIIDYQLTHLVNKAINVAQLKHKANQDKKLTVFVWGDEDVGASFMNVPASIESISQRLAAEGYQTAERDAAYFTENAKKILDPFYRDYQLMELLNNDLAELMPINAYLAWFNQLPKSLTQAINAKWGAPQDNFMAVKKEGEDYFILPRIRNGNMLIMRQPPRSDNKNDESKIYHQGDVPINHFYLAAYFYAREYWHSDAIIHLGTHGSQEYLGGKERGLSMYDQGNLAVWDTPVVYPFIVDDVGEAMQTKRRGRATVISHMTPPFAAAGLQGDISELHELMHQYKQLDQGGVKQKTAKQLADLCIATNLCKDIGWQTDQLTQAINSPKVWDNFMSELHTHLEDLATANQPLGLHTYGDLAEQDLLISTLVQMLGADFSKLAGQFEHQHYLNNAAEHIHADQDDETQHSHHYHNHDDHPSTDNAKQHHEDLHETALPENEKQATSAANLVEGLSVKNLAGYQTVLNYIVLATDQTDASNAQANQPIQFSQLNSQLKSKIEIGQNLYKSMQGIHELDAMVDFLSAKYIPVKTGGDPIRHPESLATGYNLYGFDPSRVPTQAAFEQGKELVEQMITSYQQKHGVYPDKMAFSLWSIETMRHYGVLESQVLYAMGVKPKWTADGRVIGTEIIPYSELKRPRIDVVLSATGLYRDAFPNVMQLLAKAVNQVAELKEDNTSLWKNHIKLNSQAIKTELVEQGIDDNEAHYLSTIRMFSNQSGQYGSGVDDATWASDTWETDQKISDNYLAKMGYFFGADSTRWGEKAKNSQGEVIQLYAKQLSGTDIATFARSSNLFGMLSTDDPFEYFGGLSLAVRNIDGKSPDMMVANLRDANNAKAEDAALFMAKELRTRMFHPRWISEMQKEGYSGAVSLASRMDNFFGWQVVDPNLVRHDQWDEYMDIYVQDKLKLGLTEWFKQINPQALARMMERMLEAERKAYWQADDKRLKVLVEQYLQLVKQHDIVMLNDALRQNVNELATGFGLAPLPDAKTPATLAAQVVAQKAQNQQQLSTIKRTQKNTNQDNSEQVEGQKLELQNKPSSEQQQDDWFIWKIITVLIFIILFGAVYQIRRTK